MVAGSGLMTMWSRAAALTCRVAVSVVVAAPASVPVTVWSLATVEVQVWVTSSQLEPAVGLMVNKVLAAGAGRRFLTVTGVQTWALPNSPAVMVAGSGLMTMWSRAAALTCRVRSEERRVGKEWGSGRVWSLATEEVQVWVTSSQLEPAVGLMVNKVLAVRAPREWWNWSDP